MQLSSKQASKKTDFTVDLLWCGLLRLTPMIILVTIELIIKLLQTSPMQFYQNVSIKHYQQHKVKNLLSDGYSIVIYGSIASTSQLYIIIQSQSNNFLQAQEQQKTELTLVTNCSLAIGYKVIIGILLVCRPRSYASISEVGWTISCSCHCTSTKCVYKVKQIFKYISLSLQRSVANSQNNISTKKCQYM